METEFGSAGVDGVGVPTLLGALIEWKPVIRSASNGEPWREFLLC